MTLELTPAPQHVHRNVGGAQKHHRRGLAHQTRTVAQRLIYMAPPAHRAGRQRNLNRRVLVPVLAPAPILYCRRLNRVDLVPVLAPVAILHCRNRAVLVPVFGVRRWQPSPRAGWSPRLSPMVPILVGSDGRLKLRRPSRASTACISHSPFLGTGVSQWKKEGTL